MNAYDEHEAQAQAEAFRERRERIATAVLGPVAAATLIAKPEPPLSSGEVADVTVELADALMARLDRDPGTSK